MNEAIAAAIVCAVIFFLVCAFYNGLTVRFYTVKHTGIKPLRILQISDLHSSRYGAGQKKLLSKIGELQPDIICMTGDIFDERSSNANSAALIRALRGHKVFFCVGNHELYMKNLPRVLNLLKENNVTVLDGNAVCRRGVCIGGVGDPIKGHRGEEPDNFAEKLAAARAGCREGSFNILLSHRPERIKEYLPHRFDLILSGHAHGGQWRLPCLINGLYAPHQGLFPKYAGGIYRYGKTTHIVCRGLSKQLVIPRIFNPVELCCIDITG
ncbi:MAG: metallophosphoesterase [Eubacteriales bacterium]|nr:metallophosphoesterase [Eubacteriales bacterium]